MSNHVIARAIISMATVLAVCAFSLATPMLPQLPDQSAQKAKDVLAGLSERGIPPATGYVSAAFPEASMAVLPQLPDQAAQQAKDVLAALSERGIPPGPDHPPAGGPEAGAPTLPQLPDQASQHAKDVLAELTEDGIPRSFSSIPEPATISVLALAGLALLRRRR